MAEVTYTAKDITVLEGLEPVRLRPGMYIGSTGPRGLHHLVYEVVDNSVDEALQGHCDSISVTLQPDGRVVVSDNGRGIPVAVMPGLDLPAAEVVLTKLHAGGKFGGEGYKVSEGCTASASRSSTRCRRSCCWRSGATAMSGARSTSAASRRRSS